MNDAIEHARRYWNDPSRPTADDLRQAVNDAPAPRRLTEVLSADDLALIVEPKRATVARGTINPQLDLSAVARECEAAGAAAICVVTDPRLSGGSIDDVRAARAATTLPVIARDFIVDARQVLELRRAGADAVLLPARAHLGREPEDIEPHERDPAATDTLDSIIRTAHELGMEVVLSVGNDDELEFAVETDADMLNIDNRADTGDIDVERTFELLADVPAGCPVISESIAAIDQVPKLHRAGVDALLLDEGHLDTGLTNALAVYSDVSLD